MYVALYIFVKFVNIVQNKIFHIADTVFSVSLLFLYRDNS